MKFPNLLYKGAPVFLVTFPLAGAMLVFFLKYRSPSVEFPRIVNITESSNKTLFYLNFIIPYIICAVSLYACFFTSGYYLKRIYLLIALFSAILSVYILNDLFTIKILVYAAYVITVLFSLSMVSGIIFTVVAICIFLFFEFHPVFMGALPAADMHHAPDIINIAAFVMYMVMTAVPAFLLRRLFDKYQYNQEVINHLDLAGKRLQIFNYHLQELAKQRGEEAVKQDRLRFTRDLHDSCGYAFTNIIMISDAAVSQGQIDSDHSQEIFQRIRKLAHKGLNETRETLHLIRSIQEPYTKSIETIYQIKKIFEESTGISVDIEFGNMRNEYGPTVNRVISRIIQEAFTNSIRHGMATHILIQFWEFPAQLSMIVTDNGRGAAAVVKGIGLAGMEERLEAVGGSLEVSLPEEGGFRLGVIIPIIRRQ